jgi:hypothetical protein
MISGMQHSLIQYFEKRAPDVLDGARSSAPFMDEHTLDKFCSLPESEQAEVWNQAYIKAEKALGDREYPIQPETISA